MASQECLFGTTNLAPDMTLADNQLLPGFPDWQVMYTPGHTDHDLTLKHIPTQQAYIADVLVQGKWQELVPPYPLCHPNHDTAKA